jgi:hypothetical protein
MMTLKKAQEIISKLIELMGFNTRKNQEYAAGLSNAYNRAHRLLRESPFEGGTTKPLTNEELDEIIFILNNRKKNAQSYISAYLLQVLVVDKDIVDEGDTQHLLFFLGCVTGLEASICILERIEL